MFEGVYVTVSCVRVNAHIMCICLCVCHSVCTSVCVFASLGVQCADPPTGNRRTRARTHSHPHPHPHAHGRRKSVCARFSAEARAVGATVSGFPLAYWQLTAIVVAFFAGFSVLVAFAREIFEVRHVIH